MLWKLRGSKGYKGLAIETQAFNDESHELRVYHIVGERNGEPQLQWRGTFTEPRLLEKLDEYCSQFDLTREIVDIIS